MRVSDGDGKLLCESKQFIGMTTSRSRSAGRIVLAYNRQNAAAYRGTMLRGYWWISCGNVFVFGAYEVELGGG
jgi:hypothetical protein